MIKNSIMKFIDSCVGNIARKIEDEFKENDHPRDKSGKFTSKGGEGRGGGKEEKLRIQPSEEQDDDEGTENSAAKDVKSVRSALDEELFELATTSESEEEFKSKVKRRFDQYRMLLKQDDRLNELPVGGERAEYALKKIQSEIDSGTSEYW